MADYKTKEYALLTEKLGSWEQIQTEDFQGFSMKTIIKWVAANCHKLDRIATQKISELASVDPGENASYSTLPEMLMAHIKDYRARGFQDIVETTRVRARTLTYGVYLADYFNLSCHELFFNCSKPVVLSKRVSQILKWLDAVPYYRRKALLAYLSSSDTTTTKIEDLVKDRLHEIATELYGELRSVYWESYFKLFLGGNNADAILRYVDSGFSETKSMFDTDNHAFYMSMVYFLLFVCIRHNISLDRILQRDYSHNAVFSDGSALSQNQKEFLSAYLCADYLSREKLFQELVYGALPISITEGYNGSTCIPVEESNEP